MSRKYKRQVRKEAVGGTGGRRSQSERQPTENRSAGSTPTATASRAPSTSQPAFNPDYSYVAKDLRRIGLLAGTFISILVILTFFLR